MTLLRLWVDEEYPIYSLHTSEHSLIGDEIEVPDEIYKRYLAAVKEWNEVQKELKRLDPMGGNDDD